MQKIFIYGAGGHAKVIFDAISKQNDYHVFAIYDDDPLLKGKELYECEIRGGREEIKRLLSSEQTVHGFVAIGQNEARMNKANWLTHQGFQLAKVIHPSAQIAQGVFISDGSAVLAGAVVNADTAVGKNTIINTGATVDHDCVVGDGVHIAPGVTICGTVRIGDGSLIGAGATIVPNIEIGNDVTVAAGATVICDLPYGACVSGTPAKPMSVI